LAIAAGVVFPAAGEALAIVAGQINGMTISVVRTISEWDWPRSVATWNGSGASTGLLLAAAIAVMLGVSRDFRRAVRDARSRLVFADEATGMLMLGAGVGACAAVLIAALAR
jgi:hypothetical protein